MKKLKTFLNILLALVFVFSAVMMVLQALDNSGGESEYREAAEIAMGTGTAAASETTRETVEETTPATKSAGELIWVPEEVSDDPVLEELKKQTFPPCGR